MTTERAHDHDRKHDDDQLHHDDRGVGRLNRSALMHAPEHPVTSGLLARKAERDDNGVAAGADAAVATAAGSSGSSLPSAVMRKFESSLGADLSAVRVHTGAESQSAASAVGAKAYTMGQDIHFGAGQYDPSSGAGEHLLAHEVAHTVQQGGGTPTRQNKLEVSTPFDPAEHEADTAADSMVAGRSASVSFGSGVARKVMREKEGPEVTVSSKGAEIQIPEIKLGEKPYKYATFSAAVKASGSLELVDPAEGEGEGGVSGSTTGGTNGPGIQAAAEVVQEKVKRSLLGVDFETHTSEKLSYEINAKKVSVAVAVEIEAASSDPEFPIQGTGGLTLTGLEAEWEDLEKDPGKIKVITGEAAIGLKGGGLIHLPGTEKLAKSEATVEVTGEIKPNWGNIGVEIAKKFAQQGATNAGTDAAATTVGTATAEGGVAVADTAVAIDASAVGAAAAAVIVPLGAAALMVGGAVQTGKNIDASAAAAAYGTKLRVEAAAYAKAYAATIGGSQKMTNRGSLDANIVVMEYMASSGKARQEACADLLAKNGPGLEDQILKQTRDKLYELGCAEFDTQYASEFGFLEHLGPTWGMRGVFRGEFQMLLYANDF